MTKRQVKAIARKTTFGSKLDETVEVGLTKVVRRQVARVDMTLLQKELRRERLRRAMGVIA